MILTKDESMCLVLGLSEKKEISSKTKLNKLLARLNFFFIPIEFKFYLNKYGSFSKGLEELRDTEYYKIESYTLRSQECHKYLLTKKGDELFEMVVKKKLLKILRPEDFKELGDEIKRLSVLRADEIVDNEHKELLVDVEDRFKLEQRMNTVSVELIDLYEDANKIKEESTIDVRLKALIEFSYNLAMFLKEKRFKRLEEDSYDFEAHMFDYYLLRNIEKIIQFLKKQISCKDKDEIKINRYYHYIFNSVKEYPFSVENRRLKELVCA